MNAARLLVLACSATKRELGPGEVLPLSELYDGPTWRVLRSHERDHGPVAGRGVAVLALSAEHGLVPASFESASYDRRLDRRRAIELESGTTRVLRAVAGDVDEALVVAGVDYLPALALGLSALVELGVDVNVAAGGIGYKLRALRVWLDAIASTPPVVADRVVEWAPPLYALPIELAAGDGPAVPRLVDAVEREVGVCVNHECRRFEYRVAVDGDVELAVCDDCSQRLCHESGLTWADAAAAGYRRDTERRGNRA